MAKLELILTHKLNSNDLSVISRKASEDSGEDWVTAENIQHYNATLNPQLNVINKIVRFLFVLHPYIGFLCSLLVPPIILLPISITPYGINYIVLVIGAFLGFFFGSFIFPNLVSSCKACGALKKCKRIFAHCLKYEEHTEERFSNGVRYKYLVRTETVFCVYECKKCKSRKIEILQEEKEKRL